MSRSDTVIRLVDAESQADLDRARHLFRSYAEEYHDSIAESLCFQGFEDELAGLPGRYAPPTGCLILAMVGERLAGCVAMRDLGDGICEMKRLYVASGYRGRGLGGLLVAEILRRAERVGYARIRLDTVPEMVEAVGLYRSFGFEGIAPYGDSPVARAIYMEKPLRESG